MSKGERLQRAHAQKQSLIASGIEGWDLMENLTTLELSRRESSPRSQRRCQSCWFNRDNCICQRIYEIYSRNYSLPPMPSSLSLDHDHHDAVNVKLLILMHPKEYLCAGNSAKLLRMLFPEQEHKQKHHHHTITVQYYIFGKLGDVDKLAQEMMIDMANTMILWPDKDALTVSQFLDQRPRQCCQKSSTGACSEGGDSNSACSTIKALRNTNEIRTPEHTTTIRAVLLDGTYTQARNMHKSLRKHLQPITQLPIMVQLHPMNGSVFHRAQKNYGHAHQHHQRLHLEQSTTTTSVDSDEEKQEVVIARRVSTAEACGQLLLELGAPSQILENIVESVIVNNEALRRHFTTTPTSREE
jgi:DTW domain-containing protein YfiP